MALDVKQHVIQSTVQRFEESLQHMYNLGFDEGKKSVQRTGKWIRSGWAVKCSECSYDMPYAVRNYCPSCGAKMVVEQ